MLHLFQVNSVVVRRLCNLHGAAPPHPQLHPLPTASRLFHSKAITECLSVFVQFRLTDVGLQQARGGWGGEWGAVAKVKDTFPALKELF